MAGAFPVSGQIDPHTFPFLLVDLHHSGATGSLKVEGPSYQKALYFRGGRILFGSSNDPRDQLGAILIETGTLTPEQLEEATSKVGPGSPLAKVLSETGFVSQRELGEAARAKVERILSDIIGYTSGGFEFEDGVLPKGAVDLKLSTERVLLAAVRRVTDRGFVLRHLEGLDVVLTPVPAMKGKLPEVEAEASELLARLDGRSTLKDAAAGTRLDEFDAAKLACTLVFLGILRRGPGGDAPVESDAPFSLSDLPAEIDLLATARDALTDTAPPAIDPPVVPPPATTTPPFELFEPPIPPPDEFRIAAEPEPFRTSPSADEPEMSIFVPDDVRPVGPPPVAASPAAEPVPIFVPDPEPPRPPVPSFTLSAGEVPIVASAAPLQATPITAPYIPSRTPDLSIPPAPSGVGPSKREAREWKPPARSGATPPPGRPNLPADLEIEPNKPAASRPSKDDLAALDALLNAKGLEGPLQPLERPASSERWSPQFAGGRDRSAAPLRTSSGPGRGRAAVIALGLALAATAAFWYYFGRSPQGASASVPTATLPEPTPAVEVAQVTPPPATVEAAPVPTLRAAPPTTAAPNPVPVAPATPPPRTPAPTGGGRLREARALLSGGNLPAAARGFAAHLRAAPAGTASVQLLVACSAETVQKAVSSVSSPELYIVPVKYQGRDCYRLCWGLYPDPAQAATAARALPDYFRKGGASPRVMSAAELLP